MKLSTTGQDFVNVHRLQHIHVHRLQHIHVHEAHDHTTSLSSECRVQ